MPDRLGRTGVEKGRPLVRFPFRLPLYPFRTNTNIRKGPIMLAIITNGISRIMSSDPFVKPRNGHGMPCYKLGPRRRPTEACPKIGIGLRHPSITIVSAYRRAAEDRACSPSRM